MFKGLTGRWSAFGVVLMLTIAQLNTSCCSHRKAVAERHTGPEVETTHTAATVGTAHTAATLEATATERVESLTETEHGQTRETETTTATLTEVEIYDTTADPDPITGAYPVKARIRQRTDQNGTSREAENLTAKHDTEAERAEALKAEAQSAKEETTAESDRAYNGGTLDEVVVEAAKEPSLWARLKQGAAWAAALLILAAAGAIIYKLKKR